MQRSRLLVTDAAELPPRQSTGSLIMTFGRNMKFIVIFLTIAAMAMAADITLPSGRTIKLMGVGPMTFTSNMPNAWVLQYETIHPFTERKEIIDEVEDIWTTFRLEVEKRKMKMGIIKVVGPASGTVIQQRTEINFVFEPKDDGTWSMLIPDLMKEKTNEPNK